MQGTHGPEKSIDINAIVHEQERSRSQIVSVLLMSHQFSKAKSEKGALRPV